MSDSGPLPRVPACTNCVRRKTKCDRKSPCNSCAAAKIQCQYVQKRPKKKQRVLLSSRYEENLGHIKQQIETLSGTLQSLVQNVELMNRRERSADGQDPMFTNFRAISEGSHSNEDTGAGDQRQDEPEPPLSSQLEGAVGDLDPTAPSVRAKAADAQATAIGIVQGLIQDAQSTKSSELGDYFSSPASCAFSQYPELAHLNLPPMDHVLRLLTFAKTMPQRYFIDIPHSDEEDFADLCQRIYFPTRSFTLFAWISANCGLFFLFRDLDKAHYDKLHLVESQVSDAVTLCSGNIDRGVNSLKLCVGPSYEAVDALICATAVSMEGAKGSLSWKLVSAAARMTVDLGYHCLPPGRGDRHRSQKRKLFWYVYSLDRSLAFNFGRSPTIQDMDVTTERPSYSEDFKSKWGLSFLAFIDFTKTQNDVYEQLFSAKSHQEPLSVRVQKAHGFATKISQARHEFKQMMSQGEVPYQGTVREAIYSVDIGFSSMLTLIYRVLPPDDPPGVQGMLPGQCHPLRFHPLCVEAGRSALRALVCGWNMVSAKHNGDGAKTFIKWTSLFIPFMPFIAVFGNQILTGNREDLTLLRDVFRVIKMAAEVSSTMSKICKAFSQLFRIAELWTNAIDNREQRQAQNLQTQQVAVHDQGSRFVANGRQPSPNGSTTDVHMRIPSPVDFSMVGLQDLDVSRQNWDSMFNEFDLGLGAENAREMMPWFEQHLSDFSTFD